MKVLYTGCTFDDDTIDKLEYIGIELSIGRTDYSEDELISVLKEFDSYIIGGDEICTKRVIDSCQNLKLISYMGNDYQDHIDVEAAKEKNIPVTYTPGVEEDELIKKQMMVIDSISDVINKADIRYLVK